MTNINNLYLPLQSVSVPQSDDRNLEINFKDQHGNVLDLTGVQEIEFAIFTTYGSGAAREITKTLTGGDITIYGNDYQFSVPITNEDTEALLNRLSYYECKVTNSDGDQQTVMAGLFRCERTQIWSIA